MKYKELDKYRWLKYELVSWITIFSVVIMLPKLEWWKYILLVTSYVVISINSRRQFVYEVNERLKALEEQL